MDEHFKNMKETLDNHEGFPVVAMALDSEGKMISKPLSNKKGHGTKTDSNTHAENSLLELFTHEEKNAVSALIITFPACSHCLEKINHAFKNLKTIHYLFDPWGKVNKKYVKDSKVIFNAVGNHYYVDEMWKSILNKYDKPSHRSTKKRLLLLHNSEVIQRHAPK